MFTPGSRACGYKTVSGRHEWLNHDPIGERGGINLYGFVGNNPGNKVDAYGLDFAAMFNNFNPYYQPPPPPSFSFGIQGTVGAEFGQVAGAGFTFTGGIGLFYNPQDGYSIGSFLSSGGFVGGANLNAKYPSSQCQTPGVLGASGGLTGGVWASNAGLPGQLDGGFNQYNLNSPISGSYAVSGDTWISTLGGGPFSGGASVSAYPTTTFNTT